MALRRLFLINLNYKQLQVDLAVPFHVPLSDRDVKSAGKELRVPFVEACKEALNSLGRTIAINLLIAGAACTLLSPGLPAMATEVLR